MTKKGLAPVRERARVARDQDPDGEEDEEARGAQERVRFDLLFESREREGRHGVVNARQRNM